MANNKSNTMELDSILAEARSRKSGASASSRGKSAVGQASPVRKAAPAQARSLNDDFIFTDDGNNSARQTAAPHPAASYQQPKKKKKKTGLIVAICIISVLIIAAAGGLTLYLTSGSGTGPDSTFSDNVYVNGKSLKDMTMDQARALMKGVEEEMANGIKIQVKAGDKTYDYTKNDFKYSFDTEKVLGEAKAYSEEKGLKTEDQNYEIKMTVEDATCPDLIKKIAEDVKKEPKDAQVVDFDPDAESMFTISDETKGASLDEQASLNALSGLIKSGKISGTVDATVKEVDPKVTAGYLRDNIVKLSSFSTISTNNSNGNENMRVSLAACNGSIINPGETWSFNDHTGDSNLESNGYKPAGVIIQGRSETGVGGGICQSSTTIYNACILCGMDVVERQCHYYKSVYVDAGRDATVDYGNIDLKVSNPFTYQLFMKCWMDGTELNCEIYGMQNPEFDDIEISTTDPSYFDRGYKVYTTRTYLKDGAEVKTDELPSSTYYTSAPSSGGSSGGSDDEDADSADEASSDTGDSDSAEDNAAEAGDAGDGGNSAEAGDAGEGGGEGGE